MIKEITKEEARARIFDKNVYVLTRAELPAKDGSQKFKFTPLCKFGNPAKIEQILDADNVRFLEDTEDGKEQL